MRFYSVSRIGVVKIFYPLLSVLVERWRPETHIFVLSIDEVTMILEDIAHIFCLPIDGQVVSGYTDSNDKFLQSQNIAIFGRDPVVSNFSKILYKGGMCLPYQRRRAIRHFEVYLEIREMPDFLFVGFNPIRG
ncbi:hypothetical protein AHAS_Ahas01G0315400 [Arachis hypogaea]